MPGAGVGVGGSRVRFEEMPANVDVVGVAEGVEEEEEESGVCLVLYQRSRSQSQRSLLQNPRLNSSVHSNLLSCSTIRPHWIKRLRRGRPR